MPQQPLLRAETTRDTAVHCPALNVIRLRGVLKLMLKAISSWKALLPAKSINEIDFFVHSPQADGKVPLQYFRDILAFLRQDCWCSQSHADALLPFS